MTNIETLSNQIIPLLFTVAVGWYISHFAKATIPRLLFFIFGAYFAILGASEFDRFIGLGLVLPHIKFFYEWAIDTFHEFRRGTIDIYYSFLTLYYKIRNVFIGAYRFFSGKTSSDKKSTGSSYYEKQEYRQYEDFGQSSQNHNKQQQRQEEQKQEENYSYQDTYENHEEFKYHSQKETHFEEQQETEEDIADEYKQFFFTDEYIILGVSKNDDCNTIKKKWRKLQREYHPDLNMNMYEFCNDITSRINGAYSTIKKQKAC